MKDTLLSLINNHPEVVNAIWAAVIWPFFSGLMLTLFDKRLPKTDEEWASKFASNPKMTAFVMLLKASGFHLPNVLRSVRAFFAGPAPKLPLPAMKPTEVASPEVPKAPAAPDSEDEKDTPVLKR